METIAKRKKTILFTATVVDVLGMAIVIHWLLQPDDYDGLTIWTILLFSSALLAILLTFIAFILYGQSNKQK